MEQQDVKDDGKIIARWYGYAAQRPGFVGFLLKFIRERMSQSVEEQRHEFGVEEQAFLRLQGMPLPRSQSFSKDAHRIAEECGLTNPFAFVRIMVKAQNLQRTDGEANVLSAYRAAFDEDSDLDKYPEET